MRSTCLATGLQALNLNLLDTLFPTLMVLLLSDMIGSITDQRVFEDLVEEYLPEIDVHLSSIDLPLALVSFPWFVCIFIGYIPMEVSSFLLKLTHL